MPYRVKFAENTFPAHLLDEGTIAPPNAPALRSHQSPADDDSDTLDGAIHLDSFSNPFAVLSTMVQLTEVVDEHFQENQPGPEDDDDYSDTVSTRIALHKADGARVHVDSEISNESDYDPSNETLGERLYALRDIIPPQTRASIANGVTNTTDAVKSVFSFGGKTLWVIATSALVLGVPWALAFAEEQQVMDMEKEMKMREMGGEILTAGGAPDTQGSATAQQVGAALGSAEAKPAL
ncbi:Mitochondrial import receptor subunit tom22 [Seiridium cupressi]